MNERRVQEEGQSVGGHVRKRFRADRGRILAGAAIVAGLVIKLSWGRNGAGFGMAVVGALLVVGGLIFSRASFVAFRVAENVTIKVPALLLGIASLLISLAVGLFFWPPAWL